MTITDGRFLLPELELSLGLWQGSFRDIDRLWLRWMTTEGELIPVPSERATAAEQEAADARQRAERLAARLRELGVDPNELE